MEKYFVMTPSFGPSLSEEKKKIKTNQSDLDLTGLVNKKSDIIHVLFC